MVRPFIPVPNTAECALIYGVAGQVLMNVIHVEKASPWELGDLQALRTLVNQWDIDSWASVRNVAVLLTRIRTKSLEDAASPMEDYALPVPRGGGYTGYLMSLNVTFACKLASPLAGRSQRGRLYMPGIDHYMMASTNAVTSTYANNSIASLNLLRTRLTAHSPAYKLVVTSFRTDKAWRDKGHNTECTQVVYVDLNTDSQRRRLTGRGHT